MTAPATALYSQPVPDSADSGEVLTVDEVAALLRVSPSTVYTLVKRKSGNRLPGVKVGREWRFLRRDVLDWMRRQTEG